MDTKHDRTAVRGVEAGCTCLSEAIFFTEDVTLLLQHAQQRCFVNHNSQAAIPALPDLNKHLNA